MEKIREWTSEKTLSDRFFKVYPIHSALKKSVPLYFSVDTSLKIRTDDVDFTGPAGRFEKERRAADFAERPCRFGFGFVMA